MTPKKKLPVSLLFGGLAGLGMILVTFARYKGGPQAFVGGAGYLMYLFPIVLAVVAALVERKRGGGYLGFRAALRTCFGIIVLALALNAAFTWILLHLIDPAFDHALRPVVLAQTEAKYRRFGIPEDDIAKAIADQKDSDPFSLGSMIGGLAIYYIPGFLIALLLSALVKKKNPTEA